ncbi:MAG: sensor histidine kinase [Ilumatobacteraceae bacterium]
MTLVAVVVAALAGVSIGFLIARRRTRPSEDKSPVEAPLVVPQAEVLDVLSSAVIICGPTGDAMARNSVATELRRSHSGLLIDDAIERHVRRALHGGDVPETIDFYGPPKQTVVVEAHRLASGGAVAIVEDVTTRRRLDAMRTDFVANISHELKTPVGAIAVLADALVGEDDVETVQRLIQRMVREAERASRTIDDLLELSEIEQQDIADLMNISVNELLHGVMERFAQAAEHREISLIVQSAPPLCVAGDPRQLSSALGNLVDNAIKYSESGGEVCLTARSGAGSIEIEVRDSGVGIPAKDLERIFERFYRVDRARSRETGGTGLGLAIVRHVVANHGGEVSVTSVEGEGSRFVLTLPIGTRGDRTDSESGDITHEVNHL